MDQARIDDALKVEREYRLEGCYLGCSVCIEDRACVDLVADEVEIVGAAEFGNLLDRILGLCVYLVFFVRSP